MHYYLPSWKYIISSSSKKLAKDLSLLILDFWIFWNFYVFVEFAAKLWLATKSKVLMLEIKSFGSELLIHV